jgi:hypothetical protein
MVTIGEEAMIRTSEGKKARFSQKRGSEGVLN